MSESTELSVPETIRVEDVTPPPAEATPEERPRNPRDAAMARIAVHYEEQQRANEIAYGETLSREAAERERAEPEAPPEPEPAPPAPEPPAKPAPAPTQSGEQTAPVQPQLRTVVVQGHPFQVTDEQLLHLASIGAVANMAMAQQQAQPQHQPPPVQARAPEPHAPLLDRERAGLFAHRLSYGSTDEQIGAVQELAETIAGQLRAQQPQLNEQQVASSAAAAAYERIRLEHDMAQIGAEYPEIFQNQARTLVAAINLTEVKQRDAALGRQRPPIEQYREACNVVRDAFTPPQSRPGPDGQPAAPQAAVQATATQSRLDRKRAAPRNPAALSRAAAFAEPDTRARSNSQIIDDMRRSRGQMPLN